MLTYPMEERGTRPLYEYLCRRIRAESAKMEHCVGKGGYDKEVKSGKTQIRRLSLTAKKNKGR